MFVVVFCDRTRGILVFNRIVFIEGGNSTVRSDGTDKGLD
jgi:hypothetical protein